MRMELLLFTSSQVHIKRTHKIVIAIINKLPMPNHFRNLFFYDPYADTESFYYSVIFMQEHVYVKVTS